MKGRQDQARRPEGGRPGDKARRPEAGSGRPVDGARRSAGAVLAIETSGAAGSVALAVDGTVAAERVLAEPGRHAAALIPAVREVLAEAGGDANELTGIVVGAGPGSFTGVRIAGAAAKALASSLHLPLYPVSSLRAAAVAGQADPPDGEREVRYVLFDARRGRVYGAAYDVGDGGVVRVIGPHGGTIVDVIGGRPPLGTVFMGDGATAHEALIRAAGFTVRPAPAGVPGAGALIRCCAWVAVDVAAWEPSYVREWKPG